MTGKRRTIIRAAHGDQPYFLMLRSVSQNTNLSYEALGLLCYLLSKPNDWQVHPETLVRFKTGYNRAYKLLAELRAAGHIERITHRDERNRITLIEYVVHEQPLHESHDEEIHNHEIPDEETHDITEYRGIQSTEERENALDELTDGKVIPFTPQPDGGAKVYSLIEAWLDAWDISDPRYRKGAHATQKVAARQLADMGATSEDITAMCAERRAKGKQPDECPLRFIAFDFVAWKSRAETNMKRGPILETAEQKAAREAAEEEARIQWRKEQYS